MNTSALPQWSNSPGAGERKNNFFQGMVEKNQLPKLSLD